ncbi:hypothetical protein RSAG8_10267, partial [Rhizoctonia solani AG-8 WAC10335]
MANAKRSELPMFPVSDLTITGSLHDTTFHPRRDPWQHSCAPVLREYLVMHRPVTLLYFTIFGAPLGAGGAEWIALEAPIVTLSCVCVKIFPTRLSCVDSETARSRVRVSGAKLTVFILFPCYRSVQHPL